MRLRTPSLRHCRQGPARQPGAWFPDRREQDGHRRSGFRCVINHGEAVQEREPGASTAEEAREFLLVDIPGTRQTQSTRSRHGQWRVQRERIDGSASVQAFDEPLPSNIDSQVFGLVQHPQTVLEIGPKSTDLPPRVRIRRIRADAGDGAGVRHVEYRRIASTSVCSRVTNSRAVTNHCRASDATNRSRTNCRRAGAGIHRTPSRPMNLS